MNLQTLYTQLQQTIQEHQNTLPLDTLKDTLLTQELLSLLSDTSIVLENIDGPHWESEEQKDTFTLKGTSKTSILSLSSSTIELTAYTYEDVTHFEIQTTTPDKWNF
jgi:hypothetical protein